MVKLQDGRIIRRHQDHLRIRKNYSTDQDMSNPVLSEEQESSSLDMPIHWPEQTLVQPEPATSEEPTTGNLPTQPSDTAIPELPAEPEPTPPQVGGHTPTTPPRKVYPRRERKPPDWYDGKRT